MPTASQQFLTAITTKCKKISKYRHYFAFISKLSREDWTLHWPTKPFDGKPQTTSALNKSWHLGWGRDKFSSSANSCSLAAFASSHSLVAVWWILIVGCDSVQSNNNRLLCWRWWTSSTGLHSFSHRHCNASINNYHSRVRTSTDDHHLLLSACLMFFSSYSLAGGYDF